eukprot:TRINITY_DN18613_c0_g1_i1.p1 TRINITY_DN18613_c0_g1~~TRINITY_DN18613_c0_g1_i1.p1  ORF type:complete len:493 (-),score=81.86 TRINITY_DN18613_c0_g1_i1:218-1696(-)
MNSPPMGRDSSLEDHEPNPLATGLQFRTELPDLKLLPLPPDIKDSTSSPTQEESEGAATKADPETLARDETIFYTDSQNKKRIKGGSITSIVSYFLTHDIEESTSDFRKFLICYRKFCTPAELWMVVTKKFFPTDKDESPESPQLKEQRKGAISFIMYWLDFCAAQDFFSVREKFANPLWKGLQMFLVKLRIKGHKQHYEQLVKKVQQNSNVGVSANSSNAGGDDANPDSDYRGVVWGITQTLFPRSLVPGEFVFLDLHAQEVAHSLTITEHNLFKNIRVKEFLEKTWIKDTSRSLVYLMVNRFNHVAFWVAGQIVQNSSLSGRKAVLERFIAIADTCYQIHNYNSAMEILAGLSMTSVSRLKKTWGALSSSSLNDFKKLEDFMKPVKNYQDYRAKIQECKSKNIATLPWIGIYLKDLTFIDENDDYLSGGLINFEKIDMLGGIIEEVEFFQGQDLVCKEVEEPIVQFLNNLNVLTEKEVYDLSLKQEPRGS